MNVGRHEPIASRDAADVQSDAFGVRVVKPPERVLVCGCYMQTEESPGAGMNVREFQ